jgi:hypothetical protein
MRRLTGRAAAIAAAWLASAIGVTGAAETREGITVVYRAPLVSVEARDARLDAVLAAVGEKAGFTVVQSGGVSRPVTISIQDATVDDVLRLLLRSENHTLLYRAQQGQPRGVLDEVVLLGAAPGASPAAPAPRPAASGGGAGPAVAAPLAPRPAAPEALSALPPELAETDEPTLSDVLRSHASASLRATEAARAAGLAADAPAAERRPTAGRGGAIELSPEAQDALAATTRQAQQSLKALVDGLEAATQSLQQQSAPPQRRQPSPAGVPPAR